MDKLKVGFSSAVGRNRGRISSYHRERGQKNLYTIIDFGRSLLNIKGKIKFIKLDFYRTSYIAGVFFTNGIFAYMLASNDMKVGDFVYNTTERHLIVHNNRINLWVSCQLKDIKTSEYIYNLEYFPGSGGKVARSAGTFVKIIKKYEKNALVKLYSGEFRLFSLRCMCTIGRVSNINHGQENLVKAGNNRLFGWRPVVRGRAMNPVDHPHGGRTNGGIVPRTPWGALTRGIRTVKDVKVHVIKRRKK